MKNKTAKNHLKKAYSSLLKLSETDGNAAIARREIYYAMNNNSK